MHSTNVTFSHTQLCWATSLPASASWTATKRPPPQPPLLHPTQSPANTSWTTSALACTIYWVTDCIQRWKRFLDEWLIPFGELWRPVCREVRRRGRKGYGNWVVYCRCDCFPGPAPQPISELLMRINSEDLLVEGPLKFNAFVCGLLKWVFWDKFNYKWK